MRRVVVVTIQNRLGGGEWYAHLDPPRPGDPEGKGPTEHDAVCSLYIEIGEREDEEAERRAEQRNADRVDGYDRDDLGESPDY